MRTLQRFEFNQIRMGVDTRIVVYAPDEPLAVRTCREAYHRIAQLEAQMSDYRTDSELNLLCERAVGRWVEVSPELFFVLWRAQRLTQQTDGAFDITLGPLVALWREARRTLQLPTPAELEEARKRTGWRKVQLSPSRRAVRLERPGMRLDLGGIAKGFACDQALKTLRRYGLRRALVQMEGREVVFLLAKNPAGFNEVLRTVLQAEPDPVVLIAINDLIADGRDISWDFEAQVRTCYALIDRTLKRAGGSLASLVWTTTYILDPRHGDGLVKLRAEHFPDGKYPCSALLTVSGFARPGILVEIQGIAVVP